MFLPLREPTPLGKRRGKLRRLRTEPRFGRDDALRAVLLGRGKIARELVDLRELVQPRDRRGIGAAERASLDRERTLQQRRSAIGIALQTKNAREVRAGDRGLRVVRAANFHLEIERALEQSGGFVVARGVLEAGAESRQRRDQLGRVRP